MAPACDATPHCVSFGVGLSGLRFLGGGSRIVIRLIECLLDTSALDNSAVLGSEPLSAHAALSLALALLAFAIFTLAVALRFVCSHPHVDGAASVLGLVELEGLL